MFNRNVVIDFVYKVFMLNLTNNQLYKPTNARSNVKWSTFQYDRCSNVDGSNPMRSNVSNQCVFPIGTSNQWEVPMQWTNEYHINGWTNDEVWTLVLAYIRVNELIRSSHPGTKYEGIREYLEIDLPRSIRKNPGQYANIYLRYDCTAQTALFLWEPFPGRDQPTVPLVLHTPGIWGTCTFKAVTRTKEAGRDGWWLSLLHCRHGVWDKVPVFLCILPLQWIILKSSSCSCSFSSSRTVNPQRLHPWGVHSWVIIRYPGWKVFLQKLWIIEVEFSAILWMLLLLAIL